MKIEKEFAGMKFALIEDTDEKPPANKIVTACDTYEELQGLVCVAIFGEELKDLDPKHRDEFDAYMKELAEDGYVNFEADPSISVGLFNPPLSKIDGLSDQDFEEIKMRERIKWENLRAEGRREFTPEEDALMKKWAGIDIVGTLIKEIELRK